MSQLIAIGFWNDGSEDCPLHNPQEFVDTRGDPTLRESLFHYLRSGSAIAHCLGYSWCRFSCEIDEREMGSADVSDGVWIWPEGLAHYVACHEVRLPDEFVAHARANRFQAPRAEVEPGMEMEANIGFWAEWCEQNSNGDPNAQALWRRTPDEALAAEREVIAKLIEKHGGTSDEVCSWAGCDSPALRGLAFCPSCAHHQMGNWP